MTLPRLDCRSRAKSGMVTVRLPGDGTHAVIAGMIQSRGKPRRFDRSAWPVATRIPRDPKAYRECRILAVSVGTCP